MFARDTRSNDASGKGKLFGIGLLETDAARQLGRGQPPGLGEHRRREVDSDDLRSGIAPREQECRAAGSGAEVEDTAGLGFERVQRGLQRGEGLRAAHLIPVRRDPVELASASATGRAARARGRRTTWFVVNRANLLPSVSSICEAGCGLSAPGCTENVSAALPPLIAIAMFS